MATLDDVIAHLSPLVTKSSIQLLGLVIFLLAVVYVMRRRSRNASTNVSHDTHAHQRFQHSVKNRGRFEIQKIAGHGPHCRLTVVTEIRDVTQSNLTYAVKSISHGALPKLKWSSLKDCIDKCLNQRLQSFARKEAKLLDQFSRDSFFASNQSTVSAGGRFFYVTDLSGRQSLTEMLTTRGTVRKHELRHITSQLVAAIGYAHENGIVLGSIKPAIIFIDDNNDVNVLTTDLLTKRVDTKPSIGGFEHGSDTRFTTLEATLEAATKDDAPSFAQDWIDLGLCIVCMMARKRLAYVRENLQEIVRQKVRPNNAPANLLKLLFRAADYNLTVENIKKQAFFEKVDWKSLRSAEKMDASKLSDQEVHNVINFFLGGFGNKITPIHATLW